MVRLMRPIIIAAGGTGGHVYPALAVAERLRDCGVPLIWIGTRNGLESRVVPGSGYDLMVVRVNALRGKGLLRCMLAVAQLGIAVVHVALLLVRIRPAALIGMGGFVSAPAGIAAWMLRVPLLIHEQNMVAGWTNRMLAPLATRIMQGFPGTTFPVRYGADYTGNPVRSEILRTHPPEQRFASRGDKLRVLIVGGSQGATTLNSRMPAVLAALAPAVPEIWHQTGEHGLEATRAAYGQRKLSARVDAFIELMHEAYTWADLVICRAGALTVCELAAAGVGSVLIPYPHAVDDHQSANANFLSAAGAAIVVPEPDAEQNYLVALLTQLLATRERLFAMAKKARTLAVPDATERVANQCLEFANA